MVNQDSPTFKGLFIGITIRYALIGSGIVLLSGLLKNINLKVYNNS